MARHHSKRSSDYNYGGKFGSRPQVVSELRQQAYRKNDKQKVSKKLENAPFGTKVGIITNMAGRRVMVPYKDFIYHTMKKRGRIPMEMEEAITHPDIREDTELCVKIRDTTMKLRGIGLAVWIGLKKEKGHILADNIVIMTDEQAQRIC